MSIGIGIGNPFCQPSATILPAAPLPPPPPEPRIKKRRALKDATEATIKKLITNDSLVFEKMPRSTSGKTETFLQLEHEKEQTMSDFIVMPKIQIPVNIKTEALELTLLATIFCHSSYNHLRAIYFNSTTISPRDEKYRYACKPGILGVPNHDEKGFTITIRNSAPTWRGEVTNTGFGKFDYSPAGAEEYLRSYMFSRAMETRHTNVRRKIAYQAGCWALPASAKMLMKIFFKKYGPAETPITEEMLGTV